MNLKKIKCILLDFDLTLYSGEAFSGVDEFYNSLLNKAGCYGIQKIDFENLKKIYPKLPHRLSRIIQYLRDNFGSADTFLKLLKENVYDIHIESRRCINSDIVKKVCKLYKVYVVSDSSRAHVEKYLKFMKIKPDTFYKILSNNFDSEDMSKTPMMKSVLDENNYQKDEIIMIGDSKNSDIKPAKALGIQTYLTYGAEKTEKILSKLIKLKEQK